ncbi:MAG: hypothetical protein ACMUIP_06055 [bacterium]
MRYNRAKLVVLILILLLFTPTRVKGGGRSHCLGMDIIRLIDKAQYDGMFNLFYQGSLSPNTALVLGYSSGDTTRIIDIDYKIYSSRYLNSIFFQVGGVYIDENIDDDEEDSDIGFKATLGYEHSPIQHIVFSGAVKCTTGIRNPVTGDEDPYYQPMLSLIIGF